MNEITREQEIYFELRYVQKITNFKNIAKYENVEENIIRDQFRDRKVSDYILEKINSTLNIELSSLDNIVAYFKDYKKWHDLYYSNERKIFFSNPLELVKWFNDQDNTCGYCGVTQSELNEVVKRRGNNLTLNKKKKRSRGTLEIERKKPAKKGAKDNGYRYDNCILACPLCNNAKSNLIDEDCWRELFVEPIQKYYEKLLNDGQCKNI